MHRKSCFTLRYSISVQLKPILLEDTVQWPCRREHGRENGTVSIGLVNLFSSVWLTLVVSINLALTMDTAGRRS